MQTRYGDVAVVLADHVATVEIQRPPNNFFDTDLIRALSDAFEALDNEAECRAIVLASDGKHFCAGANFQDRDGQAERQTRSVEAGNPLYVEAVRLFACRKPVVGAIQGAAIGGGFGLALMPDFRVLCPETRFSANFVKLGFHPGFGLTYTLPRLIGWQRTNLMFYTGRRISGESLPTRITCVQQPWSLLGRSSRTPRWQCSPCGPPCAKVLLPRSSPPRTTSSKNSTGCSGRKITKRAYVL